MCASKPALTQTQPLYSLSKYGAGGYAKQHIIYREVWCKFDLYVNILFFTIFLYTRRGRRRSILYGERKYIRRRRVRTTHWKLFFLYILLTSGGKENVVCVYMIIVIITILMYYNILYRGNLSTNRGRNHCNWDVRL